MTENNAAQPGLTDREIGALWAATPNPGRVVAFARAIESALLSKLRAEGVQAADDTLTQVYDRFGIGVLARNPSTLMACLGNVIRRANCLSQVEQVLSVPTPPEPEDDGVRGEESLLRWGADEKGYAEHFRAALAEWSRRAALASAPVAGEAQKPVAWAFNTPSRPYTVFTTNPDQDNLKRDKLIPLYAAPQASEAVRNAGIELAAAWVDKRRHDFDHAHGYMESDTGAWSFGRGDGATAKGEYSAELADIAEGLRALKTQADKDGGDCAKGAVQVCPECDIAGCKHIRAALSPTQPTEQGERDE